MSSPMPPKTMTSNRITRFALAFGVILCMNATIASAVKKAEPKGKAATRPFIEETRIIAPRRVGDFLLEDHRYDPENKMDGAMFRYQHPDHPQFRVDLFIYPVGDMETEKALDRGMSDFVASMEPAVKAGYYQDVVPGETVEFDIQIPLTDNSDSQSSTPETQAETVEAKRSAILSELLTAGAHVDGRRMSLRYGYRSEVGTQVHTLRSRTYLFHRQLYFFKGRISAAESLVDEATYSEFADRAMRTLIPAVQAYNIGSCGDSTIYVDKDASKEEAADQLMRKFLEITIRNTKSNCHGKVIDAEFAKLAQDAVIETIKYTASDWGGK